MEDDYFTKFRIENESNFNELSDNEQKAELIRKEIYILYECIEDPHIPKELYEQHLLELGIDPAKMVLSEEKIVIEMNEKLEIGNYFYYDKKPYDINPKVYERIYDIINSIVKRGIHNNELIRKKQIEQTVSLQTNKKDALSELKKQRRKHLKKHLTIHKKGYFFLYLIENYTFLLPNIKDVGIKRLIMKSPDLVVLYIFDKDLENHKYVKLWTESTTKEQTVMFYNEKIKELNEEIEFENSSKSIVVKSNNPLSELLFKEDGEEIFNYIVSKYPKKKSKAFFSYLFFFIKKIDKSNIEGNDSVDYRKYILEEFGMEFPRIIYSISDKQNAKEKINKLFDKYFFEYNLLKLNKK